MLHTLFELSSMSREQLEAIADEHGVRNAKKLDMENIAYAILDAEAKEESLKPSDNRKQGKTRSKKAAAPAAKKPAAKKAAPAAKKPAAKKPAAKKTTKK